MLFSSLVFLLLFLPVMLLGYHVVLRGRRRAQNLFLLAGSLVFYAWGEPWFVLVMLGSILLNYLFGLWAHALLRAGRAARPAAAAAVAVNLLLLYLFKYLTFTLETLSPLGFQPVLPLLHLPIGISFFTFQALSYVLDVAWGRAQVQRSLFDLGLYISFFPQLIAGPIVKYADVAQQIRLRRDSWADFSAGTARFLLGLAKKILLANQLAVVADRAFALGGELPAAYAWLGALCYTLQIYYDFSGYSDMAIGLGAMFGFHFRENFNYPYFAHSVTDFWRRWHISLSSWFRDYLYIPLGGSRAGKTLRNLFLVWLCTGIWHGADWTFVCWGMCYFLLLCLEKFGGLGRGWPIWLRRAGVFLAVNLTWVLFRAESLSAAAAYLLAMLGRRGWASPAAGLWLRENRMVLLCALVFMLPVVPALKTRLERVRRPRGRAAEAALALLLSGGTLAVFLLCVSCLVKGSYNPFIYFNF